MNLLALASVLLCSATAVLWARSYFTVGSFGGQWANEAYRIKSADGRFQASRCRHWGAPLGTQVVWDREELGEADVPQMVPPQSALVSPSLSNGWGFGFGSIEVSSATSGVVTDTVAVPYWFVMLASVTPLGYHVMVCRRARARKRNHRCTACGYDVRATPNRCPECGAIAATTALGF